MDNRPITTRSLLFRRFACERTRRSFKPAGDPARTDYASAAVVLTLLLALAGCRATGADAIARPARHSIRSDQLLILSDVKLAKDHPLVEELMALRTHISRTLALPVQQQEVVVYIFSSEKDYRDYLDSAYPGLPHRRAYFVGTPRELAVYTYWGSRIREDLRHEYTHGLLHAGLKEVPLWLDEGLAEYFEVAGDHPGRINAEYAGRLRTMVSNSWRPDLKRLERIEEFSQMQRVDYQEAWAWVHFLLHSSPDSRQILLDYIHDLRTEKKPTLLSERLDAEWPQFHSRFLSYVTSLNLSRIRTAGAVTAPAGKTNADHWWTVHQ